MAVEHDNNSPSVDNVQIRSHLTVSLFNPDTGFNLPDIRIHQYEEVDCVDYEPVRHLPLNLALSALIDIGRSNPDCIVAIDWFTSVP